MEDLVSVVIPIYKPNLEWLEETIQSVSSQTYDNIELVIMDDSPESTHQDFIESLELDIETKFLNNEENLGISKTRNRGINASEGEYITILDQDDIFRDEKVEKQVQIFQEKENIGMVMTNIVNVDSNGKKIERRSFAGESASRDRNKFFRDILRSISRNFNPNYNITSEMVKSDIYEEVGNYDTELYGMNDKEMMFRIQDSGYRIEYVDEFLLEKRYHEDNASKSSKFFEDKRILLDKILKKHPELSDTAEEVRKEIEWEETGNFFFNQDPRFIKNYLSCLARNPSHTAQESVKFLKKRLN